MLDNILRYCTIDRFIAHDGLHLLLRLCTFKLLSNLFMLWRSNLFCWLLSWTNLCNRLFDGIQHWFYSWLNLYLISDKRLYYRCLVDRRRLFRFIVQDRWLRLLARSRWLLLHKSDSGLATRCHCLWLRLWFRASCLCVFLSLIHDCLCSNALGRWWGSLWLSSNTDSFYRLSLCMRVL